MKRTTKKLIAFVEKVHELGYTFGDRDTEESKVLHRLYEQADELLENIGE